MAPPTFRPRASRNGQCRGVMELFAKDGRRFDTPEAVHTRDRRRPDCSLAPVRRHGARRGCMARPLIRLASEPGRPVTLTAAGKSTARTTGPCRWRQPASLRCVARRARRIPRRMGQSAHRLPSAAEVRAAVTDVVHPFRGRRWRTGRQTAVLPCRDVCACQHHRRAPRTAYFAPVRRRFSIS